MVRLLGLGLSTPTVVGSAANEFAARKSAAAHPASVFFEFMFMVCCWLFFVQVLLERDCFSSCIDPLAYFPFTGPGGKTALRWLPGSWPDWSWSGSSNQPD